MTAATTTEILPPVDDAIARAAAALRAGALVAFPTETVYGLGGDATNDEAVAGIFEAKGRPQLNPLIVHFADAATAETAVVFDARARRLAATFWPGPLTLVLPRRPDCRISLLCSAGLDSLAVRVPDQATAHRLLVATGRPLAAPSANVSGRVSPTRAMHVMAELAGRIALVLDDGPCRVGVESTVVALTGATPLLLRPGGVPEESLRDVVGPLARPDADAPLTSPGLLESHYAPGLPLRLEAERVAPDEALLAFGPAPLPGAAVTRNLSPRGDLREAASHLFAHLRELDRAGLAGIAAMAIPDQGLGAAINDRLSRAAAPRPGRAPR